MPEPDNDVSAELLQLALPISQKVVLVIDLVESVRLMAADESGTVSRWHSFKQVQGILVGRMPIDSRGSLYARIGDAFAIGCLAAMLLAVFVAWWRRPYEAAKKN